MEAPKTLRRPSNWQDFETLCKKLWGEIWSCPEIKRNGRNGQQQHGVDVYGKPFGEDKYFGIQCKGKDEYSNKQFTEAEIEEEIRKARLFQPPLKKLYFATTATKDAGIEEFVRIKNIENIANGLFEIHLFSWEDIVDLIDENKHTHNWYLKSQNFRSNKQVLVTFQDGSKEMTIIPKFKKITTRYSQKIIPAQPLFENRMGSWMNQFPFSSNMAGRVVHSFSETKTNLSYCNLSFKILNTGNDPLEEYKIFLTFEGEIVDLAQSNQTHTGLALVSSLNNRSDIKIWTNPMSGVIEPAKSMLVGDDYYTSDEVFLKPVLKDYEIKIKWKLVSKDYKDDGELTIMVKPHIEVEFRDILVEDPFKVGVKEGSIEDLIITETED